MAQYHFAASALIQAPAAQVYAILADYREGHPRILPKPYFVSLAVEQGGQGAGTVINFQMQIMGRRQTFHSTITEPEPGRRLVETVTKTGAVTTYTVEPRESGRHAQVTIATAVKVREGLLGTLEGWLTARTLRPIYVKELQILAAVAANPAPG